MFEKLKIQTKYDNKIISRIESCQVSQVMSSSESETEGDSIKNGDLFKKTKKTGDKKAGDKKADDKKAEKGKKTTAKTDSKTKPAKDWTDEETSLLIDLLESKPCLWDIHHAEYTKRDLKEIAYSEMATSFDTNIASIKQKLNTLRTRFGKELAKERNTKSGQSTDELYISNWTHYDELAFLTPVFGVSKSRDTLKRMSTDDKEDENDKEVTPNKSRKTIAEKKLDLLTKCTEAITANAKPNPPQANELPAPKLSAFAVYVDEKLSELNQRHRRIAEKRISDVLFDMVMATDTSTDEGTVYSQRNQFSGYNYQAVPRIHQAVPRMQQAVPMMAQSHGIPQQREAPATFDMKPPPGQTYVDFVNQ